MTVTVFHNPSCGTSRNVLAMIRHAGIEPEVVEYLKTPPSTARLRQLIAAIGVTVRDVLRQRGTPFDDLGLGDPKWTDDELLDFVSRYPILLNRPIVSTPLGTRLCRPSEVVLDLLPTDVVEEDGDVVRDPRRGSGEIAIRAATSDDWPAIATLLTGHALPLDGAEEHLSTYRVALAGSTIVGVAGVEPHGDVGLLRSVAVVDALQRSGLGSRLLAATIDDAVARRIRTLYLLTTTAAPYFVRRGFAPVSRDAAPAALQASSEFRGACPASATLMRRTIG